MRSSKKTLLLVAFLFFHGWMFASGKDDPVSIVLKDSVQQLGAITQDTLILFHSVTCSYTVDTPEGKGTGIINPTVEGLSDLIRSKKDFSQKYQVLSSDGTLKTSGEMVSGDQLKVSAPDGKILRVYPISIRKAALSGRLNLLPGEMTLNTVRDLKLRFTAGQRSPQATIRIFIPKGIEINPENTSVNLIGRGTVLLRDFEKQSIGRTGGAYSYSSPGKVDILKNNDGTLVVFTQLDLRPANGTDLEMTIRKVHFSKAGNYAFRADYSTSEPEKLNSVGIGSEKAVLTVKKTISDFERVIEAGKRYQEDAATYTQASFRWTPLAMASSIKLMKSADDGKSWKEAEAELDPVKGTAHVSGLDPGQLYSFRLWVKNGGQKGYSNVAAFYSGKMDIKRFGVKADGTQDNTGQINEAIDYLSRLGGGTLLFSDGTYLVRTVHLKSNVYLYLEKGATIKALKGSDEPEASWFCSKKYRSGLSPTDVGPYADPENFLTKQDVGHSYFKNALFFGERLDNVKIIGNGRITGDGNLVTSDKVMNNLPGNRADKVFSLKLCTNVEIGGLTCNQDLWYDPEKDEPHYLSQDGSGDTGNMLNIDRGGHFVLLATGTDHIDIHDTYLGRNHTSNVRDIYDFMGCNEVDVTNIYCKVSSDDIVKLGSDCSLGFTRPSKGFRVRNIIGDTNCNLFQIGSETADDITDVCVDNIYVLGGNKAGFSISTNDGGHVKDIHLNCGHTGKVLYRSEMYRTAAPFFISISNRGRVLGSAVSRYKFTENGTVRDELLCTNVNIGKVENITLKGVNVHEVYGGSSYGGKRWKEFDGAQRRATPIVAGYKIPDSDEVDGGLNFTLPDGRHTGYIENLTFEDIHVLVKGGNPPEDSKQMPRELGVGQYNVANLGIQPSYGLWARHAKNLTLDNCSFNYEKPDNRYALYLDDVQGANIHVVEMAQAKENDLLIGLRNASSVNIDQSVYFKEEWGKMPELLPSYTGVSGTLDITSSNKIKN